MAHNNEDYGSDNIYDFGMPVWCTSNPRCTGACETAWKTGLGNSSTPQKSTIQN